MASGRRDGRRWARAWGAAAIGLALLCGAPESARGQDAAPTANALKDAELLDAANEQLARDGRFDAAIHMAERALAIRQIALGPEHLAVATSLKRLASLYATKGDYTKAEPLLRRALAIQEKKLGKEHPDVADTLDALGHIHRTKGEYAEAEPIYRRALAVREEALGAEHPDVAESLNSLAELCRTAGNHAEAEPLYRRALAIFENVPEPARAGMANPLNNLALLYVAKGSYTQAEPLFRRALAIFEGAMGPEHPLVANVLNNLADVYAAKGDYDMAESLFRRSLALREKALGPEHHDVAQSCNNLAVLYGDKGDFAQAEPLYRRALAILEKVLGPEHPLVATSLNNVATLLIKKRDYIRAEPPLRRALAILEKTLGPEHPNVGTSLSNLAVVYAMRGRIAQAEALNRRALAILEKTLGPEHPNVAVTLNHFAMETLALGNFMTAMQSLERAIFIQERNAQAVLRTGSDEQKRAYMATLRDHTDAIVSLHVRGMWTSSEASRLALTTLLQRKGRVLDALADSFMALRRRSDPDEQVDLDRLRSITAQYTGLAWREPPMHGIDEHRASLSRLDAERRGLEADLSGRSAELQAALRPISVEDVEAAIPEGAALVDLFRFKYQPRVVGYGERENARYVAYVLRRGGDLQWVDLGEAEIIDFVVNELLSALRRASADPSQLARRLDALVMEPIRSLLGETRWVFLSPDGALNLVPFAALRDEDDRYLIERYAFTYLTSGRDLMRMTARSASLQGPVIFAAPDFNAAVDSAPNPAGTSVRSVDMGTRSFGSLPFAAEEGQALRRRLSEATLLMGAEATESAIKALRGPNLLHIATHGFFLPDPPKPRASSRDDGGFGLGGPHGAARPPAYAENPLLRSGLVFAGVNEGKSGQDDGVLTALEAAQLNLDGTKLVVLSACETAVGETKSGEGVYGLRRAFVIAGAETQVMSMWRVDDATTREQMDAYYAGLLRGGGRSEAMRQVQLAMLSDPRRAHPYYWASFIVSGNPAALDGAQVAPKPPPVEPCARGCCCDVATGAPTGSGASALAAFALVCWRCRRRWRPS